MQFKDLTANDRPFNCLNGDSRQGPYLKVKGFTWLQCYDRVSFAAARRFKELRVNPKMIFFANAICLADGRPCNIEDDQLVEKVPDGQWP